VCLLVVRIYMSMLYLISVCKKVYCFFTFRPLCVQRQFFFAVKYLKNDVLALYIFGGAVPSIMHSVLFCRVK